MRSDCKLSRREEGTLVRLPPTRNRGLRRVRIVNLRKSGRPDLRWGRVGERGKPRAKAHAMRRRRINEARTTIDHDVSAVRALPRKAEQAAPLSLALPRKGGGNPSAGASLTDAEGLERGASTISGVAS